MSHWPPLSCDDVKRALKQLGFFPEPRKSSSHEQWIKNSNGQRLKVTVDCPKAPFSLTLIDSMAHQAWRLAPRTLPRRRQKAPLALALVGLFHNGNLRAHSTAAIKAPASRWAVASISSACAQRSAARADRGLPSPSSSPKGTASSG